MANEIIVGHGSPTSEYDLLMLFPVAAPAQAFGANVVPTPSASFPAWAQAALGQATMATWQAALDDGTAVGVIVSFKKDSGLTNPQLVARVRAIYVQEQAEQTRRYQLRYAHLGTAINAT